MSPDEAYRAQTDWVRDTLAEGTSHHDWFTARARHHCTPWGDPVTQSEQAPSRARQIATGDGSASSMRALGPEVGVRMVVRVDEPENTSDGDKVPTDVYAPEPPEPEPGSVHSQVIAIPEPLYVKGTLSMLASAPTYYVTKDMVTVMESAAAAFDDLDLMPRLPAETGFVVLARPLEVHDADGIQHAHAFAWTNWGDLNTTLGTTGTAGEVWSFSSRKRDQGDPLVEQARTQWASKNAWRNNADLLPAYADRFLTGEHIGPIADDLCETEARHTVTLRMRRAWKPTFDAEGNPTLPDPQEWAAHVAAWSAKVDQETARLRQAYGGSRTVGRMQPYLAAFVLLLTQKITAPMVHHASPSDTTLARRSAPTRPSSVTVVDIHSAARKAALDGPNPDIEDIRGRNRRHLDHRHLVGSHWKWQPYGPNRELRRRIFVAGYVRGPEDTPLRVKPRATRLS